MELDKLVKPSTRANIAWFVQMLNMLLLLPAPLRVWQWYKSMSVFLSEKPAKIWHVTC